MKNFKFFAVLSFVLFFLGDMFCQTNQNRNMVRKVITTPTKIESTKVNWTHWMTNPQYPYLQARFHKMVTNKVEVEVRYTGAAGTTIIGNLSANQCGGTRIAHFEQVGFGQTLYLTAGQSAVFRFGVRSDCKGEFNWFVEYIDIF